MPDTPIAPNPAKDASATPNTPNRADENVDCDYEFSDDNLLALWLEFQKEQVATCPVTGAEINLTLANDPAQGEGEPVVHVRCSLCGREADFKPGLHQGFGWAE